MREVAVGWVLMSERELHRVEVLQAVHAGRQTVTAAARVLGISRRQAQRLVTAYRAEGAAGLRHKGRGRRSNRALSDGLRDLALTYVREHDADFGRPAPAAAPVAGASGRRAGLARAAPRRAGPGPVLRAQADH